MWRRARWIISLLIVPAMMLAAAPVWAADVEIDRLLRSSVGKDWITNSANLTNQRYSTLKQIDTTNNSKGRG